jgi:probable rRNA maturation factor
MIEFAFHETKKPLFFNTIEPWINSSINQLFKKIELVSFIFCTDDYLLGLNKTQLNHDYYTDIITFDLRDTFDDDLDCEIYISLDRVGENAETFNCTFAHELKRVMIHGLLHLTGLNDSTEEERSNMRNAENSFL